MKWLFIILLLVNVVYLGWEIDKDAKLKRVNAAAAIKIPAGTHKLLLLSELEKPPQTRSHIEFDNELSMKNFNSEPILPISLNPNTQKMVNSLLAETTVSTSDDSIKQKNGSDDDVSRVIPKKTVCYTYGPIPSEEESELLSKWLDKREIFYKQRQTDEKGKQLFWIYLAPRESLAQAKAAMNDLKQKGVKDMRLIRNKDMLNAISLGLFSSQAAVNRRLNEIKTKGYQSVVVPYSGGKKLYWFDVSIVQNADYVNELFTGFPSRFKALPVNCNAIAMQ